MAQFGALGLTQLIQTSTCTNTLQHAPHAPTLLATSDDAWPCSSLASLRRLLKNECCLHAGMQLSLCWFLHGSTYHLRPGYPEPTLFRARSRKAVVVIFGLTMHNRQIRATRMRQERSAHCTAASRPSGLLDDLIGCCSGHAAA